MHRLKGNLTVKNSTPLHLINPHDLGVFAPLMVDCLVSSTASRRGGQTGLAIGIRQCPSSDPLGRPDVGFSSRIPISMDPSPDLVLQHNQLTASCVQNREAHGLHQLIGGQQDRQS